MRALETGRYMLRVTTNGVSALIDQRGVIVKRSPQFVTHVLSGTVVPHTGATPYVWLGNWLIVSGVILTLLITLPAGRRAWPA